jgi:hypothetical protein
MSYHYDDGSTNWGCISLVVGFVAVCGYAIYYNATDPQQIAEREAHARYEDDLNSTGVLERTMPDGTQLWHSRVHGEDVYFSTSGTHWDTTEHCGRHCTRTIHHNTGTAQ